MKLFNPESKFYQWLSGIACIIEFGLLALLCSLPIITAGAAFSAMYKMFFNIRLDKNVGVSRYFQEFLVCLKNTVLIELIQIVIGLALAIVAYIMYFNGHGSMESTFFLLFCIVLFFWWIVFEYSYAYTAYFEQRAIATIRNALVISLAFIKQTLAILGLTLIIPIVFLLLPNAVYKILPLFIVVFIPVIHWWKSFFFIGVFTSFVQNKSIDKNQNA